MRCPTIRRSPAPRSAPTTISTRSPRTSRSTPISGWMDGAGYANGTLSRFLTLPNAERRMHAGAVGPRRAGQCLAVARAGSSPSCRCWARCCASSTSISPAARPGSLDEEPIHYFTDACRGMAGGRELAAGQGQPAASSRRPAASFRRRGPTPPRPTTLPGRLHRSAPATRRATSASPASTPRAYYADWTEREAQALLASPASR